MPLHWYYEPTVEFELGFTTCVFHNIHMYVPNDVKHRLCYLTLMWQRNQWMWTQTPPKPRPPTLPQCLTGENPVSVIHCVTVKIYTTAKFSCRIRMGCHTDEGTKVA